mmetsp:Transcript_29736/g.95606  ORF Transcript_29736/g.95606 Transcript_29736/m.95606 type:complete len:84 (+) Transcript_29736:2-253(+)
MSSGNPVCGGTAWTGVTCSAAGTNVVAVDRVGLALSGPLSQEFSALTAVTSLNLEDNALVGTLPLQWSALSNLVRLCVPPPDF